MPWYKSGTVSVTQNSNAVIGTGTAFIANGRVGDAFQGPDGDWYEVTNIASDTAVSIAPNYKGVTSAAGVYALAPMQGYNKATADALRQASLQVGDALDGLEESVLSASNSAAGALASKDSAATSETGASASAAAALASKNAASLSETNSADSADAALASENAASLSATNAGTSEGNAASSAAAAAASAAAANGVGQGYIEGLIPSWNSSTSISVSAGAAYMPNAGKVLRLDSVLTISGLSLTASTWHYLYLYDNSGTPAIELVATATAAAYSGTARSKFGDDSRRFLCALRTNGSGGLWRFTIDATGILNYEETTSSAPFAVLIGGTAAAATAVSCSAVVPPTTRTVKLVTINVGTTTMFIYSADNTSAGIFSLSTINRATLSTLTNAAKNIYYGNSSSSGAGSYLYVLGYGMDR